VGDSKNITLIYAACEQLWNDTDLFTSNNRNKIKSEIKQEECSDNVAEYFNNDKESDFRLMLPFYMLWFSFPTDLKNWINENKEDEEAKLVISPSLMRVPELILKTLDKFSMKSLHKMLMIPELNFLIKFYVERKHFPSQNGPDRSVHEYILKYNN